MRLYYVCMFFFISPVIVSCSGSMRYDPEQLPSAKFGEKYNIQVQLKGGGDHSRSVLLYNSAIFFWCVQDRKDSSRNGRDS